MRAFKFAITCVRFIVYSEIPATSGSWASQEPVRPSLWQLGKLYHRQVLSDLGCGPFERSHESCLL